MAEEKITTNDFIDPSVLKELQAINKEMKDIVKTITQFMAVSKANNEELKKGSTTQEEVGKRVKTTQENTQKLSDVEKEIQKIEQQHYQVLTKMVAERSEENKKLQEAQIKRSKENQTRKEELQLIGAQINSIARLKKENRDLIKQRDIINTSTKDGQAKIAELNKRIDRNNEVIKANSSNLEKQRLNIGNYKSALEDLSPAFANLSSKTTSVIGAFGKLGLAGGLAVGAVAAIAAPLVSFFTYTEKGTELLERKMYGLKAAFGVVAGELAKSGEKTAEALGVGKEGSGFWTKLAMAIGLTNGSIIALGAKMDAASTQAEKLKGNMQEIEDLEREMLVPRAKANLQLAEARDRYNDLSLSFDERRIALKSSIAIEEKAANEEIKFNDRKIEATKTQIKLAEKLGNTAVLDELNLKLQQQLADSYNLQTESIQRQKRAKLNLKSLDEEQNQLIKDNLKTVSESNQANIDFMKQWETDKANQAKIQEQMNADIDKSNKEREQGEIDADKRTLERERSKADEIKNIRSELNNYSVEIANQSFEFASELYNRQISDLERQKDYELSLAGDNAKAKESIETRYASKIAAIKRKQAIAEKAQSLFNIGINTAQAIIKFLADPGGYPGLALSIAAGILGAAQAATVAAQPIPKFAKGVTDFEGGRAIVGEEGREAIRLKSGQVFLSPETATQMMLPSGTDVYTHAETEAMLRGGMQADRFDKLISEQRATRKALASKPVKEIKITDSGWKETTRLSNAVITHTDKYFRK